MELAILLKNEDTFDEFVKVLVALHRNAQIVNPKFVMNPINPTINEKEIGMMANILPNMTKLDFQNWEPLQQAEI